ncbi:MAG: hypothetical protein WBP59_01250 [Ilumatobacteraceae bacterium]
MQRRRPPTLLIEDGPHPGVLAVPTEATTELATHRFDLGDLEPLSDLRDSLPPHIWKRLRRIPVEYGDGTPLERHLLRGDDEWLVIDAGESGPERYSMYLVAVDVVAEQPVEAPAARPWLVAFLGFVCAVLAVIAVSAAFAFFDTRAETSDLRAHGVEVDAEVTAVETVTTRKVSQVTSTGWIQTTERLVSYRFPSTDATGSTSGEDSVDTDVYEQAETTGTVAVVYLPDDPGTSRVLALDGSIPAPRYELVAMIFGLLAVSGGVVLVYYLRTGETF